MRFFFDNNLSPGLARGMKGFGEDVVHLTEVFPGDASPFAFQVPPTGTKLTRLELK